MSSQTEPVSASQAPSGGSRVSVGQFAERHRGEVIPLSNNFGYYCSATPVSEDVLKEYLEEPIAALPPTIAALLPRISIWLVPYLERSNERGAKVKRRPSQTAGVELPADFVVQERPAEGQESWEAQVSLENETVLLFAFKEQDVAEYHYRLYRHLAGLVADGLPKQTQSVYRALIREELTAMVHGEVDDESWQAKQSLIRRQSNIKREGALFDAYLRQSFIDTLTLYMHGLCCDIDVETGPRQLPSRHLRKRLNALKALYPPPAGHAVFPEDEQRQRAE